MSETSQFGLLTKKRLLPLFITQFFGAFNDNIFKSALSVIFVFSYLVADEQEDLYVNLATALLILPLFLFSATAGTLADHYEKSRLIRYVKIAEIGIACLIGAALYTRQVWLLLVVLFLLGTQSAFFSPLKFSILPQHLRESELIGGNGVVEMGTFVAILVGTIIGSVVAGMSNHADVALALSILIVAAALVGYSASLAIPKAVSVYSGNPGWNPFKETIGLIKIAAERKAVMRSILGVSWFWTLGAVYIAQFAKLTEEHLMGASLVVPVLLGIVTISIALGSITCEWLSGRRIEIGLVPVGAFGVSVFGIDFFFAVESVTATETRGLLEFLSAAGSYRVLIDMAFIGFFLGLYVVPLKTLIQARTPLDRRARVIAANNVINALCIVLGSVLSIVWLTVLNFSIPTLLLLMVLINIGVCIYIFVQVPEFTLRFVVWMLSHSLYRIRHTGIEKVPDRGAALIVCNHVSYIDALVLAGAVKRPIRFIMAKDIYDAPVLNYLFRTARTIPIYPKSKDEEAYENAFVEIGEALEAGDLLCIFPEGVLTKDGELGEFKSGVLKILEDHPVPVIPSALKGLWGSFFTHSGKGLWKGSMRLWSRIEVVIADALTVDNISTDGIKNSVAILRGDSR
ncbi:MAG: MFS transporter [Gammaproteobacteria bacterium]|nr:MFS transporter [Gammaproteobacteria bacterium]